MMAVELINQLMPPRLVNNFTKMSVNVIKTRVKHCYDYYYVAIGDSAPVMSVCVFVIYTSSFCLHDLLHLLEQG